MNKLTVIENVKCYLDQNGTAWLNLEDVARGLGFTTVATSGNDVVRWARVQGYLDDLGFSQEVAKDTFIPENIFYRLAMKAKNETAEAFQAKVADEILPAIRKHGMYATPQTIEAMLNDPDTMIKTLQVLKEERQKRLLLEAKVEQDKPLVAFAETCATSEDCISVRELAKIASKQGLHIGQNRLYVKLREWKHIIPDSTEPYQEYIDRGYYEVVQGTRDTANGVKLYKVTRVTPKGQIYIIDRLRKEVA
jgi:anti-repressor protein